MKSKKDDIKFSEEVEIEDDFELLELMLADTKTQSLLYNPGPYWAYKVKNAAKEIKRCGLSDFRGMTNQIGQSFADNLAIDIRNSINYSIKGKLLKLTTKIFPMNKIFSMQVKLTKDYADMNIFYTQELLQMKEKTRELINKYSIPYSLLGNCVYKAKIDDNDISIHYINILEQHDNISEQVNFNNAKSIFEIGPGFGINIHLLLENYKNIKKVLYLDIPPNLYVGTQYLKAFYKKSVSDYRDLKDLKSIKFKSDDSLEIFCIAPWQIEKIQSGVDILMNSHSFVEMPQVIVQNYINQFKKFPDSSDSAIVLISYGNFDIETTLNPFDLPSYFNNRKFDKFEKESLLNSTIKNIYFVSPGKF